MIVTNSCRADRLAVLGGLDLVAAGLQADFLRAGAGDDEAAVAFDGHLDAGIIDLDDQRAVGREDADHRGAELGDAGGLGQSQAAEQAQTARPRRQSPTARERGA